MIVAFQVQHTRAAAVSKKRTKVAPERVKGPAKGAAKKSKASEKKGRFRKKKEE